MSDTQLPPTLEHLLSSEVELLHQTKRPYVAKRVVQNNGQGYVLYRARRRENMLHFSAVLRRAVAAGVSLQVLAHDCDTTHPAGHWLALKFASGRPLGSPRPGPRVFRSFGRVLASLHSQESDRASSLLRDQVASTPYARVLSRADLSSEERRWVAQSSERMYRITRFQLTHGDLHRQNILVNSNEQVCFIDYELFAFEPAGLELAMVLLREYCRNPRNRQLLLENYLASCQEGIGDVWQTLCADLLFAGALRLAAQRDVRRRTLKKQRLLLAVRGLLGMVSKVESANLLAAKQKLREAADVRMLAYDAMALRILKYACTNPRATALELLGAAHGN